MLEIVGPSGGFAWVDGSAETDGSFVFTAGLGGGRGEGGAGNDQFTGSAWLDTLAGGGGSDAIDGGDHDDTLFSANRSDDFYLPEFYIPGVYGEFPAFVLDTGSEHDSLLGGAGDDMLFAGYGDDVDGGANGYSGDRLYISFPRRAVGCDGRLSAAEPDLRRRRDKRR